MEPETKKTKTDSKKIVLLGGDFCGPEVIAEAVKVLKSVAEASGTEFVFEDRLIGGAAIEKEGEPITDATLDICRKADSIMLGAVGGAANTVWTTPDGRTDVRPEQGLLKLRKDLNLYANLRPCQLLSPKLADLSPIRNVEGTDFIIVRELVGGIYFGERKEDDGSGVASDTETYSVPEVERIARMAAFLALQHNPPLPVWSLDKANVLASSRLWRKTVTRVLKDEFPQLELNHQLIDSAAMILIKQPSKMNGIIITTNMFGDIISDEASVIPGSLGLLPSASLASLPDTNEAFGLYEPCHGSAPDLGKQKVNPIATILSAAMMLKFSLNMKPAGDAVEAAVKESVEAGITTADIGGSSSTSEVGDFVANKVKELLKKE
ncbi:beta-isopropylmalate dehydrogenase [Yarrowia lipolytica]|jgi:3-isopropylmalate dehydrogenase|uniref:3-isopropylmalate dehydrogenase n=1 Tax=Yarrowia lipolytica TaxID=4952 RepID=A0A371C4P5_YARLL|nr:3-isopropylmalate dehydrogenase [Yarrowia lipolytica]RDW25286.1 beta-isopropylmalate dehydrogenase [Yarrowia lipolytica]RDW31364.1 beta-isopropylmalate dehydrogenase [Yarrowia lipolytica]RDW38910.1 beta-isopropylmalate dehydrogenase [Yarrowia lipolytica]RDW44812.1 beta-isopropylmalate dehydrogenase [Yarrowia lipolytica]